jgi:hypothetical protein
MALHRNDTANELALKYGPNSVHTLRELYGSFAPHCADSEKLSEALANLDGASLTSSFAITKGASSTGSPPGDR